MIKECQRARRVVLSHALPTNDPLIKPTHALPERVVTNRTHAFVAAITLAWRPSNNQHGGSNNVVRASGACEPDKPHSANNVLLCVS